MMYCLQNQENIDQLVSFHAFNCFFYALKDIVFWVFLHIIKYTQVLQSGTVFYYHIHVCACGSFVTSLKLFVYLCVGVYMYPCTCVYLCVFFFPTPCCCVCMKETSTYLNSIKFWSTSQHG